MKNKKILIFMLLSVLLIPTIINAKTPDYKVGKAQVKEITADYTYQFERYEKLLGIDEKYIYMLLSTEKIQKLDHEFKVVKESENGLFALENTLYQNNHIYTLKQTYSSENQKYEIKFIKYNNNFEEVSSMALNKKTNEDIDSCSELKTYNNQFYLLCRTRNTDNTYQTKQLVFNEKEILYNVEVNLDESNYNSYFTMFELNDGLYYFQENGDKNIYKITEKGEHISVKDLSDIWNTNSYYLYFKNMAQDPNGNIIFIYTEDSRFHEIKAIVFDKDFNKIKEKNIDVEDYIGETIIATDNYYLFVNKFTTGYYSTSVDQAIRLYWFDKDLNLINYVDYTNDLFKENPKNEQYAKPNKYKYINNIYEYNDSIYVSAKMGHITYSPVDANILVRFDLNQYKIRTEIVSGKGEIVPNVEIQIKGNEVTYKIKPAIGYQLKKVYIVTESNEEIEIKDNKFIMPAEDVTIKAEFELISIIEEIKNPETLGELSIGLIITFILSVSIILLNKRKRNI